jgi:hypothetical protein
VSAGGYQLLTDPGVYALRSRPLRRRQEPARDLQRRLPDRVRHLGPWKGLTGGEIDGLKLHYRLQLAEQGFVLVYQELANFSAEKSPTI